MYNFFAVINRMRYINRWGLMRNVETENIQQHSHETAVLAHALAVIANERFDAGIDEGKVTVFALYHDASEVITGDMPTPVKYGSAVMRQSYGEIEEQAKKILVRRLPPYLQDRYSEILNAETAPEWAYVKAADTLSAYIKCVNELNAGNVEFKTAERRIYQKLEDNPLPALKIFMEEFLPAYTLTLDEQNRNE